MAEQQSADSPFASRFGGGFISASQYLAENMCDRQARSKGVTLKHHFWKTDEIWKRAFLLQVRHAAGLLRVYSVEAIVNALKKPGGKRVYSLGARWLDPLVKEEQQKLDLQKAAVEREREKEKEVAPEVVIGKTGPRPVFKSKETALDKLRALDG